MEDPLSSTGDEILLRFLAIGIINVGGDDTKLEKLRATVAELTAGLKKAPAKTASYTMVAADPDIPATDPTVQEAMATLQKHWTTVANTFYGTPVAIIRAMLLDAVVQAAAQDDAIAAAFVHSIRNALPCVESSHEKPIWEAAVIRLEKKVDERADAEWATPETIVIDSLEYQAPPAISVEPKGEKVDRAALQTKIMQASGPWHGGDHNRWQIQQSPQQWVSEFGPRLSAAIAEVVDAAVAASKTAPVDFSTPLQAFVKAVSVHVDNALTAFGGATAGLQRRTNLLWWKEALYSPSAHCSYRELPVFNAAALMALDLHAQVPTFSPASVSTFLTEAIQLLPAVVETGSKPVLALVVDARNAAAMAPLRTAAALLLPAALGRGPLLSVIGHTNNPAALDAATLRRLCGIHADVALSGPAWGTLLFRELQAARATEMGTPKRPRREG